MEKKISPNQAPDPLLISYFYESELWAQNALLSGIDEVGRGCLAGPVVTCAVILHPYATHPLLKDSKILTEKQRLKAAAWIKLNSWYSFGMADHTFIDNHNIYQATLMAMKRAYYGLITQSNLPQQPQLLLIDAMPLKLENRAIKILSFTCGESKSISIAAASILAKVMRDELMQETAKLFPGFHFESNKGYGAQKHQLGLKNLGPTIIHRDSFLSAYKEKMHENSDKQISLFC
jgi:ribonuclease HII